MTSLSQSYQKILKKLNKKAAAFTLVETLIAMVILLSVMYVLFITVNGINRSVNPAVYYKAFNIASAEFIKKDILITDQNTYSISGFSVMKTIETDAPNNLFRVTLKIFRYDGRTIYEQTRVFSPEIEF